MFHLYILECSIHLECFKCNYWKFHAIGMFHLYILEGSIHLECFKCNYWKFHTLGMFHLQFVENTKTGADEYMYFHIINTLRSINIFYIAN